ncbi:hypothetical protein Droror1_Dr00015787, partial [Drosera rotundifolia]
CWHKCLWPLFCLWLLVWGKELVARGRNARRSWLRDWGHGVRTSRVCFVS